MYELNSIADADHICYFETSSEKAVTLSEDLRAAIRHASEDTNANPLKLDSMMLSAHVGGSASNVTNTTRTDRKRNRQEMNSGSGGNNSNATNSLNKITNGLSPSARQISHSHDRTYGATSTRYRSGDGTNGSFPSSSSASASAGDSSPIYRHLTLDKLGELAA